MNFLEKSLFTTSSIKIAHEDTPFWYTSGTIGPYFINTHFLFGNESEANKLLTFIDNNKDKKYIFTKEIYDKVISFYNENSLFKEVIDIFIKNLKKIPDFNKCKYISGGERRDWFFSPIVSYLTGKEILFIFKDLTVYNLNKKIYDIKKKEVCHICDLVTKASSHKRAWIPAINNVNGNIILNACIVDRDEGGTDSLNKEGIKNYSAITINKKFLKLLIKNNIINIKQFNLIEDFKNDPIKYGKNFLSKNPDYLEKSLNNNEISKKVIQCIKDNPYNLDLQKYLDAITLNNIL